jgi:hypothetical protein
MYVLVFNSIRFNSSVSQFNHVILKRIELLQLSTKLIKVNHICLSFAKIHERRFLKDVNKLFDRIPKRACFAGFRLRIVRSYMCMRERLCSLTQFVSVDRNTFRQVSQESTTTQGFHAETQMTAGPLCDRCLSEAAGKRLRRQYPLLGETVCLGCKTWASSCDCLLAMSCL